MSTPTPPTPYHPSSPNPRSAFSASSASVRTGDLYELATLDAMGVLDDAERRAFESALAAAPVSVQLQIRAQQHRMSDIDHLLPAVEPAPALRQRVIDSVLSAVGVARQHEAGRSGPALLPSRGVSAAWRLVAIGCAAAAVAFGVANFEMRRDYAEINQAFLTNAATEVMVKTFGPRFERALVNPATRYVQFTPTVVNSGVRSASGMAVLLVDTEHNSAQFFGKDLPEASGSYALVSVRADGTLGQPLLTFRASGSNVVREIEGLNLPSGSSLALTSVSPSQPGEQKMLLRSNSL